MEEILSVHSARRTDIGRKRSLNQDYAAFYQPEDPAELQAGGSLFIVADGVGGASHGEQASRYAAQKVLYDFFQPSTMAPADRLEQALLAANRDIYNFSQGGERQTRMATTLVAAAIIGRQLIVANVGDSPAFFIRGGQITQLTRDHSLLGERIQDGSLSEEQARSSTLKNQLTRSLGGEAQVLVDVSEALTLFPGDRIILCSDGLTRYATSREILALAGSGTPEEAVNRLVEHANQQGGADNITVQVIQIELPGTQPRPVYFLPEADSRTRPEELPTFVPGVERRPPAGPADLTRPAGAPTYRSGVARRPSSASRVPAASQSRRPRPPARPFSSPRRGLLLGGGLLAGLLLGLLVIQAVFPGGGAGKTTPTSQLGLLSPTPLTATPALTATTLAAPTPLPNPSPVIRTAVLSAPVPAENLPTERPTPDKLPEVCLFLAGSQAGSGTSSEIAAIFKVSWQEFKSYYVSCSGSDKIVTGCSGPAELPLNDKKEPILNSFMWVLIPIDAQNCQESGGKLFQP